MKTALQPLPRALLCVGLLLVGLPSTGAPAATKRQSAPSQVCADLERKIDLLIAQNQALTARVAALEAERAASHATEQQSVASNQSAQADTKTAVETQAKLKAQDQAIASLQETAASNAATLERAGWAASTTVSSYGEIVYTRPTKDVAASNTDVARAVIGIEHRFDHATKMVGEWEWEHAITSSSDRGESEVEQLWVEREFDNGVRGRAGLFLMPVGLLNESHEPTAYYGVYRPDTDTKIVPSTWREVGIGASGDLGSGLNWNVALTTAPNLSGWDASSTEGRERGPLQAIHGEGQFAASRTLGTVAALNWRGIPGLLVGGSIVVDNIGESQPGFTGNGTTLLMLDAHARYQVGRLDLAAEAIRAQINGATQFNQQIATIGLESPTFVPHLFYGAYAQAAYRVYQTDEYTLSPFARYEILNTAAGSGSLPVASGATKQPDERIATLGANLMIGEGVVLKADYRIYHQHKTPDTKEHFTLGNSLNLGVGFAF